MPDEILNYVSLMTHYSKQTYHAYLLPLMVITKAVCVVDFILF